MPKASILALASPCFPGLEVVMLTILQGSLSMIMYLLGFSVLTSATVLDIFIPGRVIGKVFNICCEGDFKISIKCRRKIFIVRTYVLFDKKNYTFKISIAPIPLPCFPIY